MNEAQLWRNWQDAIAMRDNMAKAAFEREWQRFQHKVEEHRAAYMNARQSIGRFEP